MREEKEIARLYKEMLSLADSVAQLALAEKGEAGPAVGQIIENQQQDQILRNQHQQLGELQHLDSQMQQMQQMQRN